MKKNTSKNHCKVGYLKKKKDDMNKKNSMSQRWAQLPLLLAVTIKYPYL